MPTRLRLSCRALLIIVSVLDNSFVDELCHFAMFADIFKDDEPGDTSTCELFLYKLIIQQASTDICLLVPPLLEKWGYKIFFSRFSLLYPHFKIRGAAPD